MSLVRSLAIVSLCAALHAPAAAQGIVYVRADAAPGGDGLSWDTALDDVHAALELVNAGGTFDQIWIAEGVYTPVNAPPVALPRERTFGLGFDAFVSIYGGFAGDETALEQRDPSAHPTVLSGDLNGDDQPGFVNVSENVYHVVTGGGAQGFSLDGLIVEGGNANGSSEDGRGAGCSLEAIGTILIRDCTFRRNTAQSSGAGLEIHDPVLNAVVTIERSSFLDNRSMAGAGAGLSALVGAASGPLTLRDSLFEGNFTVSGGAAAARLGCGQGVHVERCSFLDNEGWNEGAVLAPMRDYEFLACRFEGNRGGRGGALTFDGNDGDARLESCLFRSNVALGEGAALYFDNEGFNDVVNCTFTGNKSLLGSSIFAFETIVEVRNSILWGNTATVGGDLDVGDPISNFVVAHSLVEGGWPGLGNLSADPLLDGAAKLAAGSPCIDAGDSDEVEADHDFLGRPRRVDDPMTPDGGDGAQPRPDLGAFEHQTLISDVDALSTAAGGVQSIAIEAGPAFAGGFYWLLGSLSGSAPGLPFGGTLVPLNPDPYFNYCLKNPSAPPLSGALGNLSPAGEASASFTLPAALYPQLAGTTVRHAFVVIDLPTLTFEHSSNALPLALVP